MMLYRLIQQLLLAGSDLKLPPPPPQPRPPARLQPLLRALQDDHRRLDRRAVHYGQRYRSGYWAIYLLSALAVLSAVLPLALGWDSPNHRLHPYSGVWAAAEVLMIGAVSTIYSLGSRQHWQSRWLQARTNAELVWYLPMLAPLLSHDGTDGEANWYLRVFDPGQHVRSADELAQICRRIDPLAGELLADAWSDEAFIADYAHWTVQVLEQQRHYHHGVAMTQSALEHRIHRITSVLFALTGLGAVLHLAIHTLWLSLVTTFLPALGASLHGALAQSEAHRLSATSRRLVVELETCIGRIRAALDPGAPQSGAAVRRNVESAIAVILDEHQDWNLLVRPHHLPLG
ncbi:MAG TPA: hypothetical protein VMF03_03535 [Steroidobacteraceae bacterium]|nr:hypothetical protein [Steroidobacteraceae bacterium]